MTEQTGGTGRSDQVSAAPEPGGARRRPEHHQHRAGRRRALRGTVSVALVMALSGSLFTANARLARGTNERQAVDLPGLQANEDTRRERLATQVEQLRTEVDALTAEQNAHSGVDWSTAGIAADVAAGQVPVTGGGLVVKLDDADPNGPRPAGVSADDLVVHQQDLQAVINALWAGGAEAMMLMDQRVISTSAFQCIGNVLSLQGRRYSPAYVVTAVGDPDKLRAALDADPAVRAYRSWVAAVGLGWSVEESDDLSLPAYDGPADLTYASVPEGTEILPGLVAAAGGSAGPDQEDSAG
ncbi:DUF881 domain-containing protein [Cellulomonas sp. NPDC089187]|uniref:DUF881 domain-containing protein n=1 Tax=Cellulomonas sp. NPDC089187 TaxID=3154970 RepID=UPI003435B268